MTPTVDIREPTENEIQDGIRKLMTCSGYAVIFDGNNWLEMTSPKAAMNHAKANGWKQAWLLKPSNYKG